MSSIDTASEWRRLLAGLAAVFALFHWSALALGSDRGQAGLVVGLLVVTATLAVERAFFGQHWRERRGLSAWARPPFVGSPRRPRFVRRCS